MLGWGPDVHPENYGGNHGYLPSCHHPVCQGPHLYHLSGHLFHLHPSHSWKKKTDILVNTNTDLNLFLHKIQKHNGLKEPQFQMSIQNMGGGGWGKLLFESH